jgi:hypothetical protein
LWLPTGVRLHLSALTPSVPLLFKIPTHSYALQCRWLLYMLGIQFLMLFGLCHSFRHQKNTLERVAFSWCKPVAWQSSIRHTFSASTDYNWTTLAARHHLTLNYRPQHCCQSNV